MIYPSFTRKCPSLVREVTACSSWKLVSPPRVRAEAEIILYQWCWLLRLIRNFTSSWRGRIRVSTVRN